MIRTNLHLVIALCLASAGCAGNTTGAGNDMAMSMNGGGDMGMTQGGGDMSGGSADMAGVSADQACAAQASASCDLISRCLPFSFTLSYASMSDCVGRSKISCQQLFGLTGSTSKSADILACAGAYGGLSCDDFLLGNIPTGCRGAGTLPSGAACGSGAQCQSGYCRVTSYGSCGACTARAGEGQACSATACDYGLVCASIAGSQQCVRPGGLGATCGGTANPPCGGTLTCQNSKCAAPLRLNDACNPAASGCAIYQGQFCDSGTRRCTALQTAGVGAACGTMGMNYIYCSGGSTCPQGMNPRCVAPAADGAACMQPPGTPVCRFPAYCDGTCKIFDPGACR